MRHVVVAAVLPLPPERERKRWQAAENPSRDPIVPGRIVAGTIGRLEEWRGGNGFPRESPMSAAEWRPACRGNLQLRGDWRVSREPGIEGCRRGN